MACNCNPTIVPPINPCNGCLQVNGMLVGCSTGPLPCGETTTIDLAANNNLAVCTGVPVWSIKSYDPLAFINVTLSQLGILSFDTTDYYKNEKEFIIIYQVDCPNSILRAQGEIKVCFKNPCPSTCKDCNPCSGNCIEANDSPVDALISNTDCPVITNNFDLKTVSSYSDCGTIITYDFIYPATIFANVTEALGIISFTVLDAAISGATYDIRYTMTCSDFKIKKIGVLHVLVKNLCHDVVCATGFVCELCSGTCVAIPPEISLNNFNHQIGLS